MRWLILSCVAALAMSVSVSASTVDGGNGLFEDSRDHGSDHFWVISQIHPPADLSAETSLSYVRHILSLFLSFRGLGPKAKASELDVLLGPPNPPDPQPIIRLVDDETDAGPVRTGTETDVSSVPLSGGLPFLAAGLAGFGALARRNRQARPAE